MPIDRRSLLAGGALVPLVGLQTRIAPAFAQGDQEKAATGLAELAPDHIVSTTLYNGQFPDPLAGSPRSGLPSRCTHSNPVMATSPRVIVGRAPRGPISFRRLQQLWVPAASNADPCR